MGDEKVKEEALQIIGLFEVLPRLVVFDLDYTLWPFYCECRSKNEMPQLYPHAKGIIYAFKDKGVDMAIASRSPTANIAKTFIDKLGIQSLFVAQDVEFNSAGIQFCERNDENTVFLAELISAGIQFHILKRTGSKSSGIKMGEIFSSWSHKTEHFTKIHRKTGVPFNSMLFFDDEDRNIEAVSKMGVTSILVGNGVNLGALRQGLTNFARSSGSSSRSKQK